MLQFDEKEINEIRQRTTLAIINKLVKDNEVILTSDTLVPPDARATWNLYYYCPEHGVRLIWDRHNDKEHRCPVDGKVFRGEPYDGAWWRWLNDLNSKACYELGLLWQLTQEPKYLNKVKDILLKYAINYPHYEVHGDIPYNGPGKANAQTLCEANCHLNFARGYDFIRDDIQSFEREKIEESLLREGAEFLIAHRSPQLHNHEIRINAAVGVIGLLLGDERYINFALISDYGLHYQLNHGAIGEGMWFEGSIHYHYYALQSLLIYEKIAYKTPYSVGANPNLLKMIKLPLDLIMSNGRFPRLNDCIAGQEQVIQSEVFEFGYREYPFTILHQALQYIYSFEDRHNLEALLYGVDILKPVDSLKCQSSHKPYSGYTSEFNEERNHFMLVKHAPFGGEHDHYDRLNLVLCRNGKEIIPDLGTTGYGAELHYNYYKNSATHNTLTVDECNQSPNTPEVLYYDKNDSYTLLDVIADWNSPPPEVDSHVINQWSNEAYKGIVYRRTFIWFGDCVLDLTKVHNPEKRRLDMTYIVRGSHCHDESFIPIINPFSKVLARLENCFQKSFDEQALRYHIEGEREFNQQIFVNQKSLMYLCSGLDNPATSKVAYTVVRSQSERFSSVVLHDLDGGAMVKSVSWINDALVEIELCRNGVNSRYQYNYSTSKLAFV